MAAEFMVDAVRGADLAQASAVVLAVDTPGGLDASMRKIVQEILAAKTPVVVYVHPQGARAASAGVFILFAADVAAMSPGTNLGAAHPVQLGGKDGEKKKEKNDAMEEKIVNDAVAYLKSLAEKRGRDLKWAEAAVRKSTTSTATEAKALGLIDFIAEDVPELLKKLEGFTPKGAAKPLEVSGSKVVNIELTWRQKWLAKIADPNLAMMLLSLGVLGLMLELYSPGVLLPGFVGVIALLTGLYGLQTLSANDAGLLLVVVGLLCLALETQITSYGLLSVGGIAAFLLGGLMLFKETPAGHFQVAWSVMITIAGAGALIAGTVGYLFAKAFRRPSAVGPETLVGKKARVEKTLKPRGKIRLEGEYWNARSVDGKTVPAGRWVEITAFEGLTLIVNEET